MDFVESVYAEMEQSGITVFDCPLQGRKCISSADGFVGVDTRRMQSRREEYTALIHENGHFLSGAFYSLYGPYQVRAQYEYRADKAAVLRYVPVELLRQKLAEGLSDWELAEYFHVQPEFMRRAFAIYRDHMGLELGAAQDGE